MMAQPASHMPATVVRREPLEEWRLPAELTGSFIMGIKQHCAYGPARTARNMTNAWEQLRLDGRHQTIGCQTLQTETRF